MPPHTDQVHHAIFAYGLTLTGRNNDFGLMATSLVGYDRAPWEDALIKYVRTGDQDRPAVSICYVAFGQAAAVLRRVRGDGDNRRDICHALIGPAQVLTPHWALAMAEAWQGWVQPPQAKQHQTLQPPTAPVLQTAFTLGAGRLDTQAPRDREALISVVGAVLRRLSGPLWIDTAGLPKADGMSATLGLLWGFYDMVDVFFAGLDMPWSFSTFEHEYRPPSDRSADRRLLFSPEPLDGNGVYKQPDKVSPWSDRPQDDCTEAAVWLVEHYRAGGVQGLREHLRRLGCEGREPVLDRVAKVVASAREQRWQPPSPSREPASPRVVPGAPQYGPRASPGTRPALEPRPPADHRTPSQSRAADRNPAGQPFANLPVLPRPRADQRAGNHLDVVRGLDHLIREDEFIQHVKLLGRESMAPELQREVFDHLRKRRFHLDRIAALPPSMFNALMRDLVSFVLAEGPYDESFGMELARFLVQPDTHPGIVRAMNQCLAELEQWRILINVVGTRGVHDMGLAVGTFDADLLVMPGTVVKPPPRLVPGVLWRWVLQRPHQVAAAILMGVPVVLLLVGLLTSCVAVAAMQERPPPERQPTVAPVATTEGAVVVQSPTPPSPGGNDAQDGTSSAPPGPGRVPTSRPGGHGQDGR